MGLRNSPDYDDESESLEKDPKLNFEEFYDRYLKCKNFTEYFKKLLPTSISYTLYQQSETFLKFKKEQPGIVQKAVELVNSSDFTTIENEMSQIKNLPDTIINKTPHLLTIKGRHKAMAKKLYTTYESMYPYAKNNNELVPQTKEIQ